MHRRGQIGAVLGPGLFLLLLALPALGFDLEARGLTVGAWRAAALAAWMATWWITEPVPLPVTSLLPLVLLPFLGIRTAVEAARPYADPVIFLFLGGFLLAIAVQRWRLHERVAFHTASRIGTTPARIVGGFLLTTAFLSMWISNTAAAILMVPMALSLVALLPEGPQRGRFACALLLGVAYGASVGGLFTLIGTPPNAFLAAFARDTGVADVSFGEWMLLTAPLVLVGLPLLWFLLVRVLFPVSGEGIPGGRAVLVERLRGLGAMSSAERRVAIVFAVTASLWVLRPLLERVVPPDGLGVLVHGLTDHGIAIAAGIALFLLPAATEGRPLLVWEDAKEIPWNILLLFGGGLSLAGAVVATGLANWIGERLAGLADLPLWLVILLFAGTMLAVTELISNTAAAAALLPVAAGVAFVVGVPPMMLLVPAALAASCAFMLPVATPPNAVVYGTGHIPVLRMARAGAVLNVTFLLLLTLHAVTWVAWLTPRI